ncbi:MAG: RagB/SusD family nutrient uptake outer membrane protein [Prevotellaceae bacterium]|jgi:hypothetical protein|nr:RagB/SusD family nutrient uptake outer membrane protein [Prevotellaceae bacterium]
MKLKYNITLLLIAASLAACNDWLDIAPKDKVLEDKLYSSEDNIYSATNGLYRELTGEHLYGGQLSQTTLDVMGHLYTYPFLRPSEGDQSMPFYALAHFEYTNDNVKSRFANVWKKSYEALLHINTYIKNVEASQGIIPDKTKKILLGEAYGLRAYIHFDLFRIFGPVYINRTSAKILPYNNWPEVLVNQNEEKTYSTADEYIALLQSDLAKAIQLLEGNDPVIDDANSISNDLRNDNFFQNRNRRMNYYAVKGLEARVLQYIGKETEAAAAAAVVTDQIGQRFKWVDLNGNNFRKQYNFIMFSEVIFGINSLDMYSRAKTWYEGTDLRTGYVVDYNNLLKNILQYTGNTLNSMIDVRAWQWSPSKVVSSSAGYSLEGTYISYKYSTNASDLEIAAIKEFQPLMRLSEMCYIQAEAALNAGNKAIAVDILNSVLAHRGLTVANLLPDDVSEAAVREHLEREYYREFFGEGQVFFYHKRLGSSSMFKGYDEGRDPVTSLDSYVVPIPEAEKNI